MKKMILLIGALAIVALAAFNLNLSLNKDSKVNLELSRVEGIANNESGESGGLCQTNAEMIPIPLSYCVAIVYWCENFGPYEVCLQGLQLYCLGILCDEDLDGKHCRQY